MHGFPVTPADILIAVILLLSAALAFVRGFVRESLGLAAWVGAGLVTAYAFAPARPYLRSLIEVELLADAITGVGIFIVTLIILMIVTHILTAGVRGSRLGAIDRPLGFAFGLFRGALVVCLAYMFLVWAVPEGRPAWIEDARLMPFVREGVAVIRQIVPAETQQEGAAAAGEIKRKGEAAAAAERNLETLAAPPGQAAQEPETGYPESERKALDTMIETVP